MKAVALIAIAFFTLESGASAAEKSVRLGYFPNVTHAQALIGVQRGDFRKALGDGIKLETSTYNAGPSVIEALFAGHLDIAYIGPSPTINGFVQSRGKEVRVIAGSAANGVLVVGSKKRGITSLAQLKGKRIATPQLGNTQDISAKHYVVSELKSSLKERGGETEVIPMANPDIEILFAKDQLDAAWVPEPWGTRLAAKGLVNIVAEEKDLWAEKEFVLTNVIARRDFLEKNPDLVKKFLEAHVKITRELEADPNQFVTIVQSEIERLTKAKIEAAVIEGSFKHVKFTTNPSPTSFQKFFEYGKDLKLIRATDLDLKQLIDTRLLSQVAGNEGGKDAPATK